MSFGYSGGVKDGGYYIQFKDKVKFGNKKLEVKSRSDGKVFKLSINGFSGTRIYLGPQLPDGEYDITFYDGFVTNLAGSPMKKWVRFFEENYILRILYNYEIKVPQ